MIQNPLCERYWAKEIVEDLEMPTDLDISRGLRPLGLNLASVFSCVALFESRHCDILASLDQLMALSSGDSLYVAAPMTCDSLQKILLHELR